MTAFRWQFLVQSGNLDLNIDKRAIPYWLFWERGNTII